MTLPARNGMEGPSLAPDSPQLRPPSRRPDRRVRLTPHAGIWGRTTISTTSGGRASATRQLPCMPPPSGRLRWLHAVYDGLFDAFYHAR